MTHATNFHQVVTHVESERKVESRPVLATAKRVKEILRLEA